VECASRGGVGVDIDVAFVPRRETGMTAYEIMLSESQERMVLVTPPDRVDEITEVLNRWSLSSAVIGRITDDGIVRVRDGEKVEVEVPVTFFIDECPVYEPVNAFEPQDFVDRRTKDLSSLADLERDAVVPTIEKLLASPNIGSRRGIWEQYDHTILTNTVTGPGRGDAAVLRVKGTDTAIAISLDCNSRYCYLDPFEGARRAVAESTRNVSCVGGTPLAITNCLNFGNPERVPGNWQLMRAVEGMADACNALGIPVVSGNVSLYNETAGRPVFPTPTVGCVGVLPEVTHTVGLGWKEGDTVVLLGGTNPSLAGSEYLSWIGGDVAGSLAPFDAAAELAVQTLVRSLVSDSVVNAAHDIGLGGLALALVEMALANNVGATIELPGIVASSRLDETWFGESASRILVSVETARVDDVIGRAADAGVDAYVLGATGGDAISLAGFGSLALHALLETSESALRSDGIVANA
ncbi:MAG TPA: AIR synthase-related protein, partial [Thermomicrobiales bacterium]|nr:AIR synthase-related protein [Thermomicrobiales bacterium]